ncbi:hypothetical protein CR492_04425 [Methylocella silvestris]|uniref:Uncharacterized protein n=1 Tax=Methylocella silvestris TaxID=199596 RepID=A0A2J7TKM4_METSI|nr:hypothetical protein CR492_04425 [Methylocella silvestris]
MGRIGLEQRAACRLISRQYVAVCYKIGTAEIKPIALAQAFRTDPALRMADIRPYGTNILCQRLHRSIGFTGAPLLFKGTS